MRRRAFGWVILAVTLTATGWAPSAALSARRAAESCSASGQGRTVVANRYVRIFARHSSGSYAALDYRACPARGRKAHFLFDAERIGGNQRPLVSVAGRHVGYLRLNCLFGDHDSVSSCDGSVRAYDAVRRRERAHQLPVNEVSNSPGEVTSLVTTRSGWVAWMAFSHVEDTLEVWALPPNGPVRLIHAEPDTWYYDPARNSLAAAGDRIYWQFGETPRSQLLR